MLIADHFPKLAGERRRDRESDRQLREPPPPWDIPPPTLAAPGPAASSVESTPLALRRRCNPRIGIPGRCAETRGRTTGVDRRTLGPLHEGSSRGRALRDQWPTLRVGAPECTLWSPQLGLVAHFQPDPGSRLLGPVAHSLCWIPESARGETTGSRGFVPHQECAGSTWLPGPRRSFPRPATPTAHPRERNARPGPPWYQSGSHTVPPGCAQSPSWRARLRSGAGSPDGGVTATACALPGLDPSPFSALHPSFPANGSGLSLLLSPPLPQRLAGCS